MAAACSSATSAIVVHVESDHHELANRYRKHKKRVSSASSGARTSNTRARLHKTRECDNIGYSRS